MQILIHFNLQTIIKLGCGHFGGTMTGEVLNPFA